MKKRILSFIAVMLVLVIATSCGSGTASPYDTSSNTDCLAASENQETRSDQTDAPTSTGDETDPQESSFQTHESVLETNDGILETNDGGLETNDGSAESGFGSSTEESDAETAAPPSPSGTFLNGVDISDYVIIYSQAEPDYNKNAAMYIKARIKEITGKDIKVYTDSKSPYPHEIIVGETSRPLSAKLDSDTQGLEFALMSNKSCIAMEGDYFVIAAAAYYFVETYISGELFDSHVPEVATLRTPITEKPNNFILLIGDGMGVYQSRMFDYLKPPSAITSDGENAFYGFMFPYMGSVKTNSLSSGATDSAASGTALATGYKTLNGIVGKDRNLNDVMSLTELASGLGMATAVMSTEATTGATPAAFSAHVQDRNDSLGIIQSQQKLDGTILKTLSNSYIDRSNTNTIADVLGTLNADEDGFFLMYEEAYIDKSCHGADITQAYRAMFRFNQAIGQFMEFAFYNPDTLVIITADHETGGLKPTDQGKLDFTVCDSKGSPNHSSANVPIFAYGCGAWAFDQKVIENVQIPMTLASMWGVNDFGDPSSPYAALEIENLQ